MKILLLSKKFPFPLREGEPIAISYLARSLAALGCEVTLLVMNTTKHYFDPAQLPAEEDFYQSIHAVTVDNRITAKGALCSLAKGQSYILARFESAEFGQALASLLAQRSFDIVQLETPYLAHYIPIIRQNTKAPIAMRAHNVEHEIWERVAASTGNPLKKFYLQLQNRSLRRFEIDQLANYDLLLAITARDLAVFRRLGYHKAAVVAPVGIDLKNYRPDQACFDQPLSLAFIGALDWMPNQDGVTWFLDKVWPALADRHPLLSFHVAGKNTPDWLRKKATDRVVFHGEVPDAQLFLRQHAVLVAPLFSGSGIKIKVLEGMALGRVVVTTAIGVEGIPAENRLHFLQADSAQGFVDQIEFVIAQQSSLAKIGENARQFIQQHFDNLEIAHRVLAAYEGLRVKQI